MKTNKPRETFFLSIWEGSIDPVIGQEIKAVEFSATFQHAPNPIKWAFHGKWATVCCVDPHGTLSRDDALNFATDWMAGQVFEYAVNLDRCTVEIRRGLEKTPRH